MGTGRNGREWELITLALLRDLRQLISILPPGGGEGRERMGVIGSANDRKSTVGWRVRRRKLRLYWFWRRSFLECWGLMSSKKSRIPVWNEVTERITC